MEYIWTMFVSDVVLPVSLWKNYGIEQTSEHPEYDYCYCDVCRTKFKEQTGRDPLELKYPMEDQSWINFRLDAISRVVDQITKAVKADGKAISAAVFRAFYGQENGASGLG